MRDPERIGPTLAAVREYWEQWPDLRLGQLVSIIASKAGIRSGDPFYLEDDKLVEVLDECISE